MSWDPILKLILPDSVLVGPMNNVQDSKKKQQTCKTCNLPLSKLTLYMYLYDLKKFVVGVW